MGKNKKFTILKILLIGILVGSCMKPIVEKDQGSNLKLDEKRLELIKESMSENPENNNFCEQSEVVKQNLEKIKKASFFDNPSYAGDLSKLNAKQRLIYALNYPQFYSQICTKYEFDINRNEYIHRYLPNVEGLVISNKQFEALEEKRDSVVLEILECLPYIDNVSNNFKELLIDLEAYECIPVIINKIENSERADTYYYTVLFNIMDKSNYVKLKTSFLYRKLNKKKSFRQKVERSERNEKEIIRLAKMYYQKKITN